MSSASTRATTWLGLAAVAMFAAILSFAALRKLAILAGTPDHLAWLYPLTLDATMLVATRLWVSVDTPDRARRFARVVALSTIAASVVGNAGQHWLTGGGEWWPVVVGAVPAAVLAAVAHLAALATHRPAPAPVEAVEAPADLAPVVEPEPEPVEDAPPVRQPVASSPGEAGGDLVSRARELVSTGKAEGRKTLARQLGVTEHKARTILDQLDQERRPALHAVGGGR